VPARDAVDAEPRACPPPARGRRRRRCACRCWAGSPPARRSAADIDGDDVVLLDRSFFFPTPDYLLKVKGDSMRDDGILDGDLIGVHRTRGALGQIVVARIDDEITVKLLKIGKDCIRLLPRNPDYAPIEVRRTRISRSKACTAAWCGRADELAPDSPTARDFRRARGFADGACRHALQC
jgi:hypothetical protein